MRIVTWNMAHWSHRRSHDDAWRWVLDTLGADVLLCQECVPPEWVREERTVLWHEAFPGRRQKWGTGIVTKKSLRARSVRLAEVDEWLSRLPKESPRGGDAYIHRADGWIEAAEVEVPRIGPTTIVSVHNPFQPIERTRLAGVDVSAIKLQRSRDVWLLDVLFHFLRARLGARLLVGGDFNYARSLEPPERPRGNNEFFDRIAAESFVSLHRRFHAADERSFFKPRAGAHQLDYLFADAVTAERVHGCAIHPHADLARFSDHAPLLADFDGG